MTSVIWTKKFQWGRLDMKRRWNARIIGVKLIYQGQEKKVIIVSTIRSLLEYVSMGSQNKLGFLFNSKRFNLGIKTENVRFM